MELTTNKRLILERLKDIPMSAFCVSVAAMSAGANKSGDENHNPANWADPHMEDLKRDRLVEDTGRTWFTKPIYAITPAGLKALEGEQE